MTINTQKLREAAQRVIKAFDADWYAPGDWQETNDPLPYCDAHHIAAASPTVVIGLLDALDTQTAEIAEAQGQIEHLDRQNNALRDALLGLLDALPSATTHPAIKRAKDALRETCHD